MTRFLRILHCLALLSLGTLSAQPTAAQDRPDMSAMLDSAAPDVPLDVEVGVQVSQVTFVDQKSENFGVVATIRLRWHDKDLAFDPQDEGKEFKSMSGPDFVAMARETGIILPTYSIQNQQSRSFNKVSVVFWTADGTATSVQEKIMTLQAPDFDFREFPFDEQKFFVRVIANAPSNFVSFRPWDEATGLGDALGEEEWRVLDTWVDSETVEGMIGLDTARLSLGILSDRHKTYYWARIFVPLLLLTCVSWANLFLEEYRRRIDVAGANLLAFVAFNFTISSELPRLGYLTFLDLLLMLMFSLAVASVIYNVALRRMSINGHEDRARSFDWHVTIWGFPLINLTGLIFASLIFL